MVPCIFTLESTTGAPYSTSAIAARESDEQTFYTSRMADEFPEVSCPRCEQFNGRTYTAPLRLIPPGAHAWQHLCGVVHRDVTVSDTLNWPGSYPTRSRARVADVV